MGTGASAIGVAAAVDCTADAELAKLLGQLDDKQADKLSKALLSARGENGESDKKAAEDKPAEEKTAKEKEEAPAEKNSGATPAAQDKAPPSTEKKDESTTGGGNEKNTEAKSEDATAERRSSSVEETKLAKIHSAIRWGKPSEEVSSVIESIGVAIEEAFSAPDSKNGNRSLHIAAQNGHIELVRYAIDKKADVNVQNNKGQTPLHMSVEYDFYFQTKLLLGSGADPKLQNGDGHEALTGIDGGKTGNDAWDAPVTVLKAATDSKEELDLAFSMLEKADPATVDKAALVQAGMQKKKTHKNNWDADRFMAIMKKL